VIKQVLLFLLFINNIIFIKYKQNRLTNK